MSRDAARVALLLGAAVTHGLWVASLAANAGTAELTRRDFIVCRDAGRALRLEEALYGARPFPFLHPPPVAVLCAPLASLPPLALYALSVTGSITGLAASLLALRRLRTHPDAELDLVALGALASGPWIVSVILGQPIALALASWTIGLALLDSRPRAAGLVLAACALKPTFLLAPLGLLVVQRRGRALGGLALGLALALALSIPAGAEAWSEWLGAAARAAEGAAGGAWKQHTLLAALRAALPDALATFAWTLTLCSLVVAALLAARRRAGRLRAFAPLALGTIALSPHAYFYDALLLVLPAAALWLASDRYPPAWRRALAAIALLTFGGQHLAFFALQASAPPFLGLPATLWLVAELLAPVTALRDLGSRGPGGTGADPTVASAGAVARSLLPCSSAAVDTPPPPR